MELIPVPQASSASTAHLASSSSDELDMARFMHDPKYFPESFVVLSEDRPHDCIFQVENFEDGNEDHLSTAFAVTLPAPSSDQEWKSIVKNPKKFIAKSVQKGVEISYAKLNSEQKVAMDSAKALEVDNWMKTMAVKAAKKFVPQKELLRMRWVLTFKSSSEADAVQGTPPSQDCVKAKARIVILGYSDPHLLDASSVSPAMSRLSTGNYY